MTHWTAHNYAVVDVEGNGQRPADLVEIAVVPVVSGVVGEPHAWLVKPPRPITAMARRVHRIADAEVAGAPRIGEVAQSIRKSLEGAVFVAHNAHIDLSVTARALPGFSPDAVLDTLKIARRLIPGLPSYKLGALAASFGLADEIAPDLRPHRAAYDAIVCARLLVHLASTTDGTTFAHLLGEEPHDPAEALF